MGIKDEDGWLVCVSKWKDASESGGYRRYMRLVASAFHPFERSSWAMGRDWKRDKGNWPPIGAPLNIHNPCLSYHGQYSKGWLSFFKRLSRCPFFSFPSVFTHALISPTTCTYIEQGCQKVQYAVTESSLGEVDTILAIERDMRGSLYLHCTADCFFHLFAVIHCNVEHESSSHR